MKWFLVGMLLLAATAAYAMDRGQWTDAPLHAWFEKLQSGRGLCCSFADGRTVEGSDWGTGKPDVITMTDMASGYAFQNVETGRVPPELYWVIIDGEKLFKNGADQTEIRCFIAGGCSNGCSSC